MIAPVERVFRFHIGLGFSRPNIDGTSAGVQIQLTNSQASTMELPSLRPFSLQPEPTPQVPDHDSPELKEAFTEFVGQTLFGSMLASMRNTVGQPAYLHGGRTEEVFQKQLDQRIVEELTDASAESIAEPMFDLFNLQRR